ADGLAQPSIAGVAEDDPRRRVGPTKRRGQGTPRLAGLNKLPESNRAPRWRPLAPGEFVLGYPDEAGIVAGTVGDRPPHPIHTCGAPTRATASDSAAAWLRATASSGAACRTARGPRTREWRTALSAG